VAAASSELDVLDVLGPAAESPQAAAPRANTKAAAAPQVRRMMRLLLMDFLTRDRSDSGPTGTSPVTSL
jgi:hypothetical protein